MRLPRAELYVESFTEDLVGGADVDLVRKPVAEGQRTRLDELGHDAEPSLGRGIRIVHADEFCGALSVPDPGEQVCPADVFAPCRPDIEVSP